MKIIRLLVMAAVLGCGVVLLLSLPLYAQLKGAPDALIAGLRHADTVKQAASSPLIGYYLPDHYI